jgi:hypothetical protein
MVPSESFTDLNTGFLGNMGFEEYTECAFFIYSFAEMTYNKPKISFYWAVLHARLLQNMGVVSGNGAAGVILSKSVSIHPELY